MPEPHFIVIGNGPAGKEAADTLREHAPGARITIISKSRESCILPHLLPDFIAGKIPEEGLYLCPLEAYSAGEIKLRTCQEAVGVDPAKREVVLEHKEVLSFDGLVFAVGGVPRIPAPLSIYRDQMLTLKTLDDARVWINRLARAESVLLLGGDLTSLAMARALLHLKKRVLFVLDEGALWPLRADEKLFREVSEALSAKGVEVIAQENPEGIIARGDGSLEVLIEGRKHRADIVGAFFGLTPAISFLAGSGLRLDRGILVDEYLNAGTPGIYAAGDCAQIYHPDLGDYWVSVGHDNARRLGQIAGLNLACGEAKAKARPESIFKVQGISLDTSWWMEF